MFRPLAILASVSVLAAGAAACGDDEQSGSTPAKTTPAPVAQIDSLTGKDHRRQARRRASSMPLESLKVTPGAARGAKITEGGSAASRSRAAT